MKVGVVYWEAGDGMIAAITAALATWDCQPIELKYDAPLPEDLDLLVLPGPGGSLVPIASQLARRAAGHRPRTLLWQYEQLPSPAVPTWLLKAAGLGRSALERLAWREEQDGVWHQRPWARWVVRGGVRFRYYGDILWLRRIAVLSVLATSSKWMARYLHEHGIDAKVASWGTAPDWGRDLGLDRDIPVLWLGKPGSRRRAELVTRVRSELKRRGVEMYVVDGVERPYVFGEERTILLNRTKVVLNILRSPWDDNACRYFFSAPNKALVVTEPTLPHTPFEPGVHIVEAPISALTDTICYYLAHEDERREITERAYDLVTQELTLHNAVGRLMEVAEAEVGQGARGTEDAPCQRVGRRQSRDCAPITC